MTAPTLDTYVPPPGLRREPRRDDNGRPYIIRPDGSETTYSRASSYGKALEDTYLLERWKQRQALIGASLDPHILLSVSAHRDQSDKANKDKLNELVEQAMQAAKSHARSEIGTAVHKITETIDAGKDPGPYPQDYHSTIDCYRRVTAGFQWVAIEQFVVHDEFEVAGTTDRVRRLPDGRLRVVDLKGLALTTPLPTPDGWTTMQAVAVGDRVFGSDGKPCRVTAKSQTKRIGTYVVHFDDNSQVVCDTEHLWWTVSGRMDGLKPGVRSIEEIIATLRMDNGQLHHRIPVAQSLDLPDAELPVDPYILGCWLGDGHRRDGCITKADDLFAIIEGDGHKLGIRQAQRPGKEHIATRSVSGLRGKLATAGVLMNKHLPAAYLRASHTQRLLLLQGLMDTDGTWNIARRRAVFNSTDKALALAVEELLCTLGQRPRLSEIDTVGFGKAVTSFAVEFTPVGLNPFRLARKGDQVGAFDKNLTMAKRRLIVAVEPGPDVETACIAVDSADHTYLCGEHMIPTHNTGDSLDFGALGIVVQVACYGYAVPYDLDTGQRLAWPGEMDLQTAEILHLPAGQGVATLYTVDIAQGIEMARKAMEVRRLRTRAKSLLVPVAPTSWEVAPAAPAPAPAPTTVFPIGETGQLVQTAAGPQIVARPHSQAPDSLPAAGPVVTVPEGLVNPATGEVHAQADDAQPAGAAVLALLRQVFATIGAPWPAEAGRLTNLDVRRILTHWDAVQLDAAEGKLEPGQTPAAAMVEFLIGGGLVPDGTLAQPRVLAPGGPTMPTLAVPAAPAPAPAGPSAADVLAWIPQAPTEADLTALWQQYGGTPLWDARHDGFAGARFQQLQAQAMQQAADLTGQHLGATSAA